MSSIQILWVDDEIELLKPHILFLERKNYKITTCTNGADAIDLVDEEIKLVSCCSEEQLGSVGYILYFYSKICTTGFKQTI